MSRSTLSLGAKATLGFTLAGVLITALVSVYGVVVGRQTADKQDRITVAVAAANRAQTAPSTKVSFVSAAIDPTGQVLTLSLKVEEVGVPSGLGCSLADSEQVTNGSLPPGAGKGQGQLQDDPGSSVSDFDLAPGIRHEVTVHYHRNLDGIIQIAIDAPCSTPDSTSTGVTITVVSVAGLLTGPIKESSTPVA